MQESNSTIQMFRSGLYNLFPKRADAIINLLDALTSNGHRSKSLIQLSNVDCFDRKYSSITDAIADGLPHADFKKIMKLIYDHVSKGSEAKYRLFIIDCTPNPRQYARKLVDRHITHQVLSHI